LNTAKRHMYTIENQIQPRVSSNVGPPLHTNPTFERLPQESLSGLECLLIKFEIVVVEDGRHDQCQFHLCDVAADAGTGTVAEGYKG
jgi:hypothetical protein